MTLMSAGLGGVLAWRDGGASVTYWSLCALGLVLAHATNNLLNDLTDSRRGVDAGNYYRNQYGIHALEDGLLTAPQFTRYLAATGGAALCIGASLVVLRGGLTLPLMALGAFFVIFYTWPLKYWGLGEPAVLLVWGPLMVGGTYYITRGVWSPEAAWLGTLYGLGPTTVLFGKHIDKREMDREKRVFTLPVILGEAPARAVTQLLILSQYLVALTLALTNIASWTLIIVLLAAPSAVRAIRVLRRPKPCERPVNYSEAIWPLWFSAHTFAHTRKFTLAFLIGLTLGFWL